MTIQVYAVVVETVETNHLLVHIGVDTGAHLLVEENRRDTDSFVSNDKYSRDRMAFLHYTVHEFLSAASYSAFALRRTDLFRELM